MKPKKQAERQPKSAAPKILHSGKSFSELMRKVPTWAFMKMVGNCGLMPAEARELSEKFKSMKT
jgi:hypothetical protein